MSRFTALSADCRAMGHAWMHSHDEILTMTGSRVTSFDRHESCYRCGTERHREVMIRDGRATLGKSLMRYAPGYRAPDQGPGRIPRAEVLAEMIGGYHHETT